MSIASGTDAAQQTQLLSINTQNLNPAVLANTPQNLGPLYNINPSAAGFRTEIVGDPGETTTVYRRAVAPNVDAVYDESGALQGFKNQQNAYLTDQKYVSTTWDTSGKANPVTSTKSAQGGFFGDAGIIGQMALAVAMPELVGSLTSAVPGLSDVAAKAIIKASYNVAQGQDVGSAITNSTIDAVTQTGSTAVAKDISEAVGKVGAEAIAGAGGSIASTLAKGGTVDDAIKNATGSIVGAVTKGELGQVAGAAAGGAVTGGAKGAAMGAGGALFDSTGKPKTIAGTDIPSYQAPNVGPATQVADVSIPGFTPPEGSVVSDAGPGRMFVEIANPNDPTDKRGYTVVKDPVTGEISYEMAAGDPTKMEDVSVVSTKIKPMFFFDIPATSKVASFKTTKTAQEGGAGTTAADTTTKSGVGTSVSGGVDTSAPSDSTMITYLGGTTGGGRGTTGAGTAGAGTGAGAGAGAGTSAGGGTGQGAGGGGTGGDGTGGDGGTGFGGDYRDTKTTDKDKTDTKPDDTQISTFIYSGFDPRRKAVTLPATIAEVTSSPLQQALTGYRPAGEIEDVSTGKRRENVWNEASLRLKDALGI